MDKATALGLLSRFQRALVKQGVKEARLVLFGSYSTGTPRDDSDIDVVVLSQSFEGRSEWERIEMLSRAIIEVHPLIEAVALTPQEWESGEFMISEYARDGEVVAV